jgi:hypothetical protein
MVYRARSRTNAKDAILNRFRDVFTGHAGFERYKLAEWLFVGVATNTKWYNKSPNTDGLAHHIHILNSFANAPELIEKADWWSWVN